jgi:hypothetical protein
MSLAALYWFYKDLGVSQNHLALFKKHNADIPTYGLYGGDSKEAPRFEAALSRGLDDFYISEVQDTKWKWLHGDLLILKWYQDRGQYLPWDSLAVIQWDMLVFDSLHKQFPALATGEIFLSGVTELNETLENAWDWTSGVERPNYLDFREYVRKEYGYIGPALGCFFIFQIFPRIFFEKYLTVKNKELGMLEYKVPTYANIFGLPFYKKDVGVDYYGNQQLPMNAAPREIEDAYIRDELRKKDGWRIFHPFYKEWKPG